MKNKLHYGKIMDIFITILIWALSLLVFLLTLFTMLSSLGKRAEARRTYVTCEIEVNNNRPSSSSTAVNNIPNFLPLTKIKTLLLPKEFDRC